MVSSVDVGEVFSVGVHLRLVNEADLNNLPECIYENAFMTANKLKFNKIRDFIVQFVKFNNYN